VERRRVCIGRTRGGIGGFDAQRHLAAPSVGQSRPIQR